MIPVTKIIDFIRFHIPDPDRKIIWDSWYDPMLPHDSIAVKIIPIASSTDITMSNHVHKFRISSYAVHIFMPPEIKKMIINSFNHAFLSNRRSPDLSKKLDNCYEIRVRGSDVIPEPDDDGQVLHYRYILSFYHLQI